MGPAVGGAYKDDPGRVGGLRAERSGYSGRSGGAEAGPWGDARSWGRSRDISLGRVDVAQPQLPASMRTAVALMFGGAGLTALSVVIFLSTRGQLADSLAEANPGVSQAAIDGALDRLQGREITRSAFGAALWIWMAAMNSRGRSWARILATVFGVIDLVGLVFAFALLGDGSTISDGGDIVDYTLPYLVLGVVVGVLAVVTLALLYRPDSSRYYDETSRWRAAAVLRGY